MKRWCHFEGTPQSAIFYPLPLLSPVFTYILFLVIRFILVLPLALNFAPNPIPPAPSQPTLSTLLSLLILFVSTSFPARSRPHTQYLYPPRTQSVPFVLCSPLLDSSQKSCCLLSSTPKISTPLFSFLPLAPRLKDYWHPTNLYVAILYKAVENLEFSLAM